MEFTLSRSALLEFKDERQVMSEGFHFLDEKRLLLAAEILRQLEMYQNLEAQFRQGHERGSQYLLEAVARHGLHGVQVYPAPEHTHFALEIRRRDFFGVKLLTAVVPPVAPPLPDPPPIHPSPEAEGCRRTYTELLRLAGELAAVSGNLYRLLADYRRTERRARALEDVILPELESTIYEMAARLEELEQEEAIRTRLRKAG